MDLTDLTVFVEVADAGGVAAAARRLGLAKSIVSRRLMRLETALDTPLFARTNRGSVLNEAGLLFREHALRILAELDTAQEAISPKGVLHGRLRIAAPMSFGIMQLAPIFAQMASRHPHLQLDIAYSDRFVDLVAEGFDCAIRLGYLPDSSLIVRRIYAFNSCLVASPAYLAAHAAPRNVHELLQHQAVIQKGELWRIIVEGQLTVLRPRGRFVSDNGEAVLAAALAGVGIANLPDFLVQPYLADGSLLSILNEYTLPQLGMYVVRPAGSVANRKISTLIEILLEHFSHNR